MAASKKKVRARRSSARQTSGVASTMPAEMQRAFMSDPAAEAQAAQQIPQPSDSTNRWLDALAPLDSELHSIPYNDVIVDDYPGDVRKKFAVGSESNGWTITEIDYNPEAQLTLVTREKQIDTAYFYRESVDERQAYIQDFATNPTLGAIKCVVLRLRDKNGNRVFGPQHWERITKKGIGQALESLGAKIAAHEPELDIEETKNDTVNSETIT